MNEETPLTVEAIENEIRISEEVINDFEKRLERLTEEYKALTERLIVLRAVNDKIGNNGTKVLVEENIRYIADERFKLIPEIKGKRANIEHYRKIIDKLNEIKNEL